MASALSNLGIKSGDRVAVCLPQRIETAVALLAILQIGAVAVPLTVLFGSDALAYRLKNAGASSLSATQYRLPTCSLSAASCRR